MSFQKWWSTNEPCVEEFKQTHPYDIAKQAWNAARTMTPVSERLPDCAVDVIAWDGYDFARAWVNAKGEWCSNENLTDFCTGTVTHWMELPEVPG